MMYWKLSIRNAKRSLPNYALYAATMAILSAILEVSNCVAAMGELAGFQALSLPLLITVIEIALAGYINAFLLKQRSKELASYLLLGMGKKAISTLFLLETLLIGLGCFLSGATIGFGLYGFFHFHKLLQEAGLWKLLYGKSMLSSICSFCLVQAVCSFHLKRRMGKLQIKELMDERNRAQAMGKRENHRKWGILFLSCFAWLLLLVYGVAFLPESLIVYPTSILAIPLCLSVFAFYRWAFGWLYAKRLTKSAGICQTDRLYLTASLTADCKAAALANSIFCICFLFSACSFIIGGLMMEPELQLFDKAAQEWMGTAQISISILFLVIYFSILSLQQIIELRQNARSNQILRYIGKSSRQIERLVNCQIAIKLAFPTLMAVLAFLFCLPALNAKMNAVLPMALQNILLKLLGEFAAYMAFLFLCYFGIVSAMGRPYRKPSP